MKKLTLRMDDLAVESFPTAEAGERGGTVDGHAGAPTFPYVIGCPIGTKPTNCPCTPAF